MKKIGFHTGTVISMGVFCSLLKLSDPVIGFIAGVSQFGGSFMYAFAYTDLMIYLGKLTFGNRNGKVIIKT